MSLRKVGENTKVKKSSTSERSKKKKNLQQQKKIFFFIRENISISYNLKKS